MGDVFTIRVNCLASFDSDEMDTIRSFLIGDKEDVEVDFNYWDGDEDGTEGDIVNQYKKSSDQTMIFVDRDGLENQDYIIADGRSFFEDWYKQHVLEFYGWTYTDEWGESDDATSILALASVPYCRFTTEAEVDLVDLLTRYQTEDDFMLTSYADVSDVMYSFTGDTDDVVDALTALGISDRDADGAAQTEANEEAAEENNDDDDE